MPVYKGKNKLINNVKLSTNGIIVSSPQIREWNRVQRFQVLSSKYYIYEGPPSNNLTHITRYVDIYTHNYIIYI